MEEIESDKKPHIETRPSATDTSPEGGFSLPARGNSKNVAHRSQGLVSVGHRDGNHPAALAEAPRVVILDGIASVPSSMCSDLSGNVTRFEGGQRASFA